MNRLSPRSIKNVYRKERITASWVLAGTVDILIGGFGERATLVAFGILIVLGGVAWRWLQVQSIQTTTSIDGRSTKPRLYLPAASSRIPLPPLTKQNSRR